jgi:CRISPR system Cascade subunit CasA
MDHDLLVEPLLSWRDARRQRRKATLPGVLAHLASGDIADFPRLRPHQFHPWCMFLTQLAAIALRRGGRCDPRLPEADWRELLLALTEGKHQPWALLVEELAEPAFFQPPVPGGTLSGWKTSEAPDDIDVLVTAKSHEVKTGQIHGDDVEAWVYALVTLQTTQGYPGRGYTRIARMNGGYGNRPRLGLTADHTPASRFLRDTAVLLGSWPRLVRERGYSECGLALVWTAPWDGTSSLSVGELSPHFLEVCWRIRMVSGQGPPICLYTTTQVRRCAPEIDDGDVGDPWMPVERTGGALTVRERGFNYKLMTRLMFEGDFEAAEAQRVRADDGDPVLLVAAALARGQGKTEGLHERHLHLTGAARWTLGQPEARKALGTRASMRVAAADNMRRKVLFPALRQIALGSTVPKDAFDERVDTVFFDHLFRTLHLSDDDARLDFQKVLADTAWSELQRAIGRCTVPDVRKPRAIAAAEGMFHGCLKKNFPDLAVLEGKQQGAAS